MRSFAFFNQLSSGARFVMLLMLILVFLIIGMSAGMILGSLIYNIPLNDLFSFSQNLDDPKALSFAKFYQFINQVFIFLLPAIFFAVLIHKDILGGMGLRRKSSSRLWLLAVLMTYSILPLVSALIEWNQSWVLPEAWSETEQWLRSQEAEAERLSLAFLQADSLGGLLINVLLIALLPALGEELLFRGSLQPIFQKWTSNAHIGIILTSLLFSAMHMQFFGLIPRFVLGLLLGYTFYFSSSLWIAIGIHFVNNATAVIAFYFFGDQLKGEGIESLGKVDNAWFVVFSMSITAFLLYRFYLESMKQKKGA